jgi:hypothetical protein
MFIVYSGSEFFHPESRSRVKKIPDPGSRSASKNFSIFNPKALGNMIRDVYLDFLTIPDPGSRGQKGTGSATLVSVRPRLW